MKTIELLEQKNYKLPKTEDEFETWNESLSNYESDGNVILWVIQDHLQFDYLITRNIEKIYNFNYVRFDYDELDDEDFEFITLHLLEFETEQEAAMFVADSYWDL